MKDCYLICLYCGAVATVVGLNIYCNHNHNCDIFNKTEESYVRMPAQQFHLNYEQWRTESFWTSVATITSGFGDKILLK